MESEAMKWVRKVRDENSARHATMTLEERIAEGKEIIAEFERRLGRKLVVIDSGKVRNIETMRA